MRKKRKEGNFKQDLNGLKKELTILRREQLKKIREKERETIRLTKQRAIKERENLEKRYQKRIEEISRKIFGEKVSELRSLASKERRKLQNSKRIVKKTISARKKLKKK